MSKAAQHWIMRSAVACLLREVHDAVRPRLSPYAYSSCEDERLVVADAASGDWHRVEMALVMVLESASSRFAGPAWDVRVTMTRTGSTCTHHVGPWSLVSLGPDGTASIDRDALDALAEAWAQAVTTWVTTGGDAP